MALLGVVIGYVYCFQHKTHGLKTSNIVDLDLGEVFSMVYNISDIKNSFNLVQELCIR